eukprot:m.1410100 g.1410100  ORF g.1410100 m.1410100 type:complete len:961 (-) comp25023_c2_seq13:504-3386(-)
MPDGTEFRIGPALVEAENHAQGQENAHLFNDSDTATFLHGMMPSYKLKPYVGFEPQSNESEDDSQLVSREVLSSESESEYEDSVNSTTSGHNFELSESENSIVFGEPAASEFSSLSTSAASVSTSKAGEEQTAASDITALQRQRELLIVSLVERLCTTYGSNEGKNKRLFARVCTQLGCAGILTDQMFKSDKIAHLRERCENGFFNLMGSVFRSVYLEDELSTDGVDGRKITTADAGSMGMGSSMAMHASTALGTLPFRPPIGVSLGPSSSMPFLPHFSHDVASGGLLGASHRPSVFGKSRFAAEFEIVRRVGRGGFGAVVEARNRLDGMRYAVKSVRLTSADLELGEKVLREVTTLASLDHPNIVRYNSAWLEWGLDTRGKSKHRKGDTSALSSELDDASMFEDEDEDESDYGLLGIEHDEVFQFELALDDDDNIDDSGDASRPSRRRSAAASALHADDNTDDEDDVFFADSERDSSLHRTASYSRGSLAFVGGGFYSNGPSRIQSRESSSGAVVVFEESSTEGVSAASDGAGDSCGLDCGHDSVSSTGGCDNNAAGVGVAGGTPGPLALRVQNRPPPLFSNHAHGSLPPARAGGDTSMPVPRLHLYIQMQLCDSSLYDWLAERAQSMRPIDVAVSMNIFTQTVRGISHVHRRGLIHRDIKPRNIFIINDSQQGLTIKIGDFGLATVFCDDDTADLDSYGAHGNPCGSRKPSAASITSSSREFTSGVGTGTYASPEQLSLNDYDQKADIYSLGVVLFELLFRFDTAMERLVLLKELREGTLPAEFKAEYPEYSKLILQFTAASTADRPTADDILRMLPSAGSIRAQTKQSCSGRQARPKDTGCEHQAPAGAGDDSPATTTAAHSARPQPTGEDGPTPPLSATGVQTTAVPACAALSRDADGTVCGTRDAATLHAELAEAHATIATLTAEVTRLRERVHVLESTRAATETTDVRRDGGVL